MPIYRERPDYSKDVINSTLSQTEERQARLQQRRDRLNAESAEETGQATAKT